MRRLESAFDEACIAGCHELAKLGYRPTYFLQMLHEHGSVETARRLIRSEEYSEGFTRLWEMGRLDMSIEAFVLKPEYHRLFTEDERARARERLASLNYYAPWDIGA